jgi:type IV pilus assembly protein PilX
MKVKAKMLVLKSGNDHKGAALISSLLFLLVLTVIGITGVQVSILEERMSGNLSDRNLAFQAAESALRQGELALKLSLESGEPNAFNCISSRVCPLIKDITSSDVWNADSIVVFKYTSTLPHVAKPPLYRIEVLTPTPPVAIPNDAGSGSARDSFLPCHYRITALGTGSMVWTVAIVQSTYAHSPIFINGQGVCHG